MNLGKWFSKEFNTILFVYLQVSHVFYSIPKEDREKGVFLPLGWLHPCHF